jgi:electron transfer flavoprotein alpha subunit
VNPAICSLSVSSSFGELTVMWTAHVYRTSSSLSAARSAACARRWASQLHSLVFIEHRSGKVEGGTLAALSAASELGGKITGLVVGVPGEVAGIVEKVKK